MLEKETHALLFLRPRPPDRRFFLAAGGLCSGGGAIKPHGAATLLRTAVAYLYAANFVCHVQHALLYLVVDCARGAGERLRCGASE